MTALKKFEVNQVDNQVVKKSEVNNQVTKTFGIEDSVNVFNIVWDGWLYSSKLAQAYQRKWKTLLYKQSYVKKIFGCKQVKI